MTEPMIERLLAGTEPAERERITSAYPGYPDPAACVQFGGDFAFGAAAWRIAEAHSRHAPTYLYRYDYAPRTLRWSAWAPPTRPSCWRCSTSTERLSVSCLSPPPPQTARLRCASAMTCSHAGRASPTPGCPVTTGPPTESPDRAVRVFDRRPRVEYDPHASRREAWAGFTLAGR